MNKLAKKIKTTINDMDKPLLIISIGLFIFGLLNIVTASSREAVSLEVPLYYYFYRHLIMLLIGFGGSIIILALPTSFYKKTIIFFLGMVAVLVAMSLLVGKMHRGANNWTNIGFGTFQPSEFAKPLIIVAMSILIEKYYYNLHTKKVNKYDLIARMIAVGCIIPVLVFLQKDFGTMFIIFMIFFIMFISSPISFADKSKTIFSLGIIGVIAIMGLFILKGEILTEAQIDRFYYFAPCKNYETTGYQICNAYISINDGGLLGLGIGKSKQKYSYIAEPHTDMIFSIMSEEYGAVAMTLVFLSYVIVLYRITMLSIKANTIRGKYICLGSLVFIFMHIFINLGGLLGLIPLTGVPLPFFSYGGSFTITLMATLSLVLRVSIETKNQKIKINRI